MASSPAYFGSRRSFSMSDRAGGRDFVNSGSPRIAPWARVTTWSDLFTGQMHHVQGHDRATDQHRDENGAKLIATLDRNVCLRTVIKDGWFIVGHS